HQAVMNQSPQSGDDRPVARRQTLRQGLLAEMRPRREFPLQNLLPDRPVHMGRNFSGASCFRTMKLDWGVSECAIPSVQHRCASPDERGFRDPKSPALFLSNTLTTGMSERSITRN